MASISDPGGGFGCDQEWVEQPAGVEVNPGEEAVLACRLQGKKGDCRLGYCDVHNLMGFPSKKMPNNILKNVC
jgi:hypothetical protein